MSADVIPLGTRSLADAITGAEMQIGVLEDLEARQHAAWQQTAAELDHAIAERDRLRARQGALPWCGTCLTYHEVPREPCAAPPGCGDCPAGPSEPCIPGCLSRNEIDYGDGEERWTRRCRPP